MRWGNERRRRRGVVEGCFPWIGDGLDESLKRFVFVSNSEGTSNVLYCQPVVVQNITNALDVAVVKAKPFQLGERFFFSLMCGLWKRGWLRI